MGGFFAKLDNWFITGWRRCWKLVSVQYQFVTTLVLVGLQLGPFLPDQVKEAIPQPWGSLATVVWFGLWLLTRVKQQKPIVPSAPSDGDQQ